MTNSGCYYYQQKDYENMMKYYLITIENNHSDAINNLGFYYKEQKRLWEYDEILVDGY